jgi:hypothetical protein
MIHQRRENHVEFVAFAHKGHRSVLKLAPFFLQSLVVFLGRFFTEIQIIGKEEICRGMFAKRDITEAPPTSVLPP